MGRWDITAKNKMIRKILSPIILFCFCFSAWSQDIVRTKLLYENDELKITQEGTMYNWDEGIAGTKAYENAVLVFENKTNNRIRVNYKVEATVVRYNERFTYKETLYIDPNAINSDIVISHSPNLTHTQSMVGAKFTLINYAVEPRKYKTSW